MTRSDILIIGAGPTGLVLALWLTELGVKVRIVDKTAEPGTTSRALAVQARTLELYRQLDLTDAVIKHGHKVPAVNLWVKGKPATRLSFERIGSDLTPYPFLHIFPQDQHERLLIERLERLGVSVERRTELVSFTDEGERVIARLRGPAGQDETCEANYIAGCDGAYSTVRDTIEQAFLEVLTGRSSTSPMSKRLALRSMANCTSISTRPISWVSSLWPGKVKPA